MSAITSQPRPNEMYNIVPTNDGVNTRNNDASLEEQEEKNKKKIDNTEDIDSAIIETCCCPEPCWLFELSNSCFECIANCIHSCCEDKSNIVDGSGDDNCDIDCVDCSSKCCDD